jgi:superfamily II DNA or RNA helicase
MFSAMARRSIDKGKKVMILTDRQELMNQTHFALQQFELNPAKIIAGDTKYLEAPCYVAMIETMKRRLTTETWKELLKSIDLVIFDEAHKTAFDKIFPRLRDWRDRDTHPDRQADEPIEALHATGRIGQDSEPD